jgi:peptide deformylase
MLEILNAPNPVLSQNAALVVKFDASLKKLIEQMTQALEFATDPIGVGLAAPQIGKSLSLFITKPTLKSKVNVYANPKILNYLPFPKTKNKEKHKKLEGCLSLKDIWGQVERYPEVTLEYQDENGKKHVKVFKGFMSTIVQHEVDHLNGILFPKRVLEQRGILYKSEKDEDGHDVFDQLKI